MKTPYRVLLTLLFILIFVNCSDKNSYNNQNTSKDSLKIYFSLANDFSLPKAKRLSYTEKAYEIVIDQDNDSISRKNLFKVANRFYNISLWNDYKKTVGLVLRQASAAGDTMSMTKAYTYLGDYYDSQALPDSAFQFYYKAEKLYRKKGDKFNLGRTLISKSSLLYRSGAFLESEQSVFEALRTIKNEKRAGNTRFEANNILGLIYHELGDYETSIFYNKKALAITESEALHEEFQSKATIYNNLGYVYLTMKNYSTGKEYFQQGLAQENLKLQKPALYAMLLDNYAYSKFLLKEDKDVLEMFLKSLEMRENLNLVSGIFINKIHLSEYYSSKKDTIQAVKFSKEALILARSTKVSRDVLVALKEMAILEPENATAYNTEYIHLNEELQKAERKMGDKFTRIEYETDQLKNEYSDLETQNRNLVYLFVFILFVAFLFYIIQAQKTKNKELEYKHQQQISNEEIYNLMISQQSTIEINRVEEKKRVAQELHDGVLGRIFGVRMNLDSLNGFNDDMAVQQRNSYLSELKNIEQDIREISHDLSKEKSELINNFVAIIENLFEEQRKTYRTILTTTIDSAIKWEAVTNSVKINFYRIVQESLQNINKYAFADAINIKFIKENDHIVLTISDDGVGFDTKAKSKGIGLQNIYSRTKDCNGKIVIESNRKQGTIIIITAPIEKI